MSERAPKASRPPITVEAIDTNASIDVEAWAKRAAEIAMRVEGITHSMAAPQAAQVGSGR